MSGKHDAQTQDFLDRIKAAREKSDERTSLAARIVRVVCECGNANDAIDAVARIIMERDKSREELRTLAGKVAE